MTGDSTAPKPAGPSASAIADEWTVLQLSAAAVTEVVEKKVTCPFLGTAVTTGKLSVRQAATNPLASIEDVRRLGNTGGGDLGDLLAFFASGNHAFMRGPSGRLDQSAPNGLFSLELPGSQGSHPGHSGILQGDPKELDSGRFSQTDFSRLAGRAKDGFVKRSEVGRFIAENLHRDPNAKVFGPRVAGLLAHDLVHFVVSIGPEILAKLGQPDENGYRAHRDLEEKLTKLLEEDNLVGSAGEFGLMFAFLANKPGAKKVDGEAGLSLEDLRSMFVDKSFPNGWETWKKTRLDWVINTTGLMVSAGAHYLALQRGE
jgi:hypothetical protein